jgi:hypothetical protein
MINQISHGSIACLFSPERMRKGLSPLNMDPGTG